MSSRIALTLRIRHLRNRAGTSGERRHRSLLLDFPGFTPDLAPRGSMTNASQRHILSVRFSLGIILCAACSACGKEGPTEAPPVELIVAVLYPETPTASSGIVGETVSERPTVTARDQHGKTLPDATVTFVVVGDRGSVTGGVVVTD